MDGYICESNTGPKGTASAILSKYFGKSVHLVTKGPKPRQAVPTASFPDLKSTSKYQDMYPVSILSEESTVEVENHLRRHVGSQGIDAKWSTDSVPIERCVRDFLILNLNYFGFYTFFCCVYDLIV